MTKKECEELRKALNHLEHNPCQWEDAMAILYPLAGFEYLDWRKEKGEHLVIIGGVLVPNLDI